MLFRQGRPPRALCHQMGQVLLLTAAILAPAAGGAVAMDRRISHPDGASLQIKSVELRDDSIVLGVTIGNSGNRDIRLNASHSFVITDDLHGVHRLNPPPGNPELRMAAQAQTGGELVFIGPVAPAVRELTLSSNDGIGSVDNPLDDTPVLRATVPAPNGAKAAGQANHPNGAALRVDRVAASPSGCTVSLVATNGNDRPIRLAENGALQLVDEKGATSAVEMPPDNRELTIPAGYRLTARLNSGCQSLNTAGRLMLAANRSTGGTPDNPFETSPVMTVQLPSAAVPDPAAPGKSTVTTAPVAASQLSGTTTLAANAEPGNAVPPAAATAPPAPTPQAPKPPAPPPAPPPSASSAPPVAPAPPPSGAPASAGRSLDQLKAALHAETDDKTLQVVLPADVLFGPTGNALDPQAAPRLADLAELIETSHPREVMVSGHTDSSGEDADNQTLSDQRAKAIGDWLTEHAGKHPPHIAEKGYGRTRPVAPNHNADGSDNPDGRAKNRRIEITLRR